MKWIVFFIIATLIILFIFKHYNTNQIKQVDDTEHIWVGDDGIKFKE